MRSKTLINRILSCFFGCLLFGITVAPVRASGQILGVHILSPGEITQASEMLGGDGQLRYVTIPLSLQQTENPKEWQAFFDLAAQKNIKPLIRLTTRFEQGSWTVPTKQDVMRFATFLSSLHWHTDQLAIILYNEPNHAAEWGGTIDPQGYAQVARFTADWFSTEQKHYVILPAGLDLAADGNRGTMEAFAFWRKALASEPGLLDRFDAWVSHSYPNPAFSSNPNRTDKRSLRGYQHELAFLTAYTTKQFPVYITETGWDQRPFSSEKLRAYYSQAYEQIWHKDERVVAVTPFLFRGAPGGFSHFSFLDAAGNPTKTYEAYRSIMTGKN